MPLAEASRGGWSPRWPRRKSSPSGRRRELLGPPIALSSTGLGRTVSPALLRAGALASGATLRLDLHPSDLDHPSHMLALEWVLKRAASTREAVTYEQLAHAQTDDVAPRELLHRSPQTAKPTTQP